MSCDAETFQRKKRESLTNVRQGASKKGVLLTSCASARAFSQSNSALTSFDDAFTLRLN
jgi:hypothetical protein